MNLLDAPTTYQPSPVMASGATIFQARAVQVGSNPIHCICPQCHQQIITRVDYVCLVKIKRMFLFLHFLI